MSDAERWLREHLRDAPEALVESMAAALPAHATTVPDALAEGALALYARVVRGSGGREDALPLLAADALFTHAFQAQAELEPAELDGFAQRWGAAGRLGTVAR